MAVENRKLVGEADIPQEMGGLFHREAIHLTDEPITRCVCGRVGGERFLEGPLAALPESLARRNEIRSLVVVKPRSAPEELRDRSDVPGQQETVLLQASHGSIRRARLCLNREDAVRDLLEQPLIWLPPDRAELREPMADFVLLRRVLGEEFVDVPVSENLHPRDLTGEQGPAAGAPREGRLWLRPSIDDHIFIYSQC